MATENLHSEHGPEAEGDIIIIGGGLGGLACANALVRAGLPVTVLEAGRALGGRARTREREGFHFNLGPHALYRDGRAAQTLTSWGIELPGGVPTGNGGYVSVDGRLATFPAGVVSLLTTSAFSIGDKLRVARFMASIPRLDSTSLRSVSVNDWLDSLPSVSLRVADFVRAMVRLTTYVNGPGILSAGVALDNLQMALGRGVLYLDGGWQRLVDALATQVQTAGGTIITGAKVTELCVEPGRLTGVQLGDGRLLRASAVVFAIAPIRVARLLAATRAELSASRAHARLTSRTPVLASCLDVGLRGRLPRPGNRFALGIDRPSYLSLHSDRARLCAPSDALIHVAHYLADGAEPAPVQELEQLLDQMQPGWRERVASRTYMPKLTVCHDIPRASDGGRRLGCALSDLDPDLAGGYLVGDWVGDSGMLADAVFASALAASAAITGARPGQVPSEVTA